MSYCFNPTCQNPKNLSSAALCQSCGTKLLLKGRYRSLKLLGQGGFGQTFLAVDDTQPQKPRCVVKQFLPRKQSTEVNAAALFRQEAARLSQLGGHPQIPDLLAYIEDANQLYIVQSFIEGDNLAQKLAAQGAFSEVQVHKLLTQMLTLLDFVHEHQVIHRDIKPENIIQSATGSYALVDFGAAKVVTGEQLAKTGTLIGSASYAAPEQAAGKAIFASDLYSLGVTCLRVLTNLSPFDLYDLNEGAWAWRDFLSQPISPKLSAILDKMIAQGLRRRYQSAAEALQDLQSLGIQDSAASQAFSAPRTAETSASDQGLAGQTSRADSVKASISTPKASRPRPAEPFVQVPPRSSGQQSARSAAVKGVCIRTLEGHTKPVHALVYRPDGQQIASVSEDSAVRLWQAEGGRQLRTLGSGSTGSLDAVAFSADGQIIAASGYDGVIRLWQTMTGMVAAELSGHSRYVSRLAFSADGRWLASASYDNTLRFWKIDLGQRLFLWQRIKAQPVHVLTNVHSGWVCSIAFSPDGQELASVGEDGTVKVWQIEPGRLLRTFEGHEGMAKAVTFSPSGRIIASSGTDKTIKLWNAQGGGLLRTISVRSEVNALLFSRRGQAVIGAQSDCNIRLWQVSTGEPIGLLANHSDIVHGIALSPDGNTLVSGSADKTIKIWSLKGL